ncbi:unnamed protein product, partial [Mesorhabditis belari]|uniref:Transmembrane protein 177 n=1 Tax=Mesorhabditis belari TaxID=2138241 RepID=A0AAF3E8Y0_9BILA
MFTIRRFLSYRSFNHKATEFLKTKWGQRFKIGLLGGTIIAYPLGVMALNGPLVNLTFPLRHTIEEMPPYLAPIFKEEYTRFLDKEGRRSEDAVVRMEMLSKAEDQDTVYAGTLGIRTGLRLAVPFFARFRTLEDAIGFLKSNYPNGFPQLGENIVIDWDSKLGRLLAETFVLSEQAWRFVFLRDLYAHDGYAALGQSALTWATFTSFSGIFTFWMHRASNMFKGSFMSFIGFYIGFTGAAAFGSRHWHLLYRYLTDIYADSTASRVSPEHSAGGREYYFKWLKRNRILREIYSPLYTKVTLSGDVRGIATQIIIRYDHLKDVDEEDDAMSEVFRGDF